MPRRSPRKPSRKRSSRRTRARRFRAHDEANTVQERSKAALKTKLKEINILFTDDELDAIVQHVVTGTQIDWQTLGEQVIEKQNEKLSSLENEVQKNIGTFTLLADEFKSEEEQRKGNGGVESSTEDMLTEFMNAGM